MKYMTIEKEGHEYSVYGCNLSICPDTDETIQITDPKVILDGQIEMTDTDCGQNFIGHAFNIQEVASSIIRAFINNDMSFKYKDVIPYITNFRDTFSKNIEVKGTFSDDEKGQVRIVPNKYLCQDGAIELQVIDKDGFSYYSDDDRFALIRPDGSLATDMESFYWDSMVEALLQGNLKYSKKR